MPSRHHEERISMRRHDAEIRNENGIFVLINRHLKTCVAVFAIILVCGFLASIFTYFIAEVLEKNFALDSSNTTLTLTSTENQPSDSWENTGLYILIFVLGGIFASVIVTFCWYFLDKKFTSPYRPTSSPIPTTSSTAKSTTQTSRPLISSTRSFKPSHSTPKPQTITPTAEVKLQPDPKFRIVGYYDAWSAHEIRDSQLLKLTHVVFSALDMTSKGALSFNDHSIRKKFLDLNERSRKVNPSLKVMFSIGEYATAQRFESVASDDNGMKTLANSICDILQTHNIDGVDLFWKWPTTQEHRENYVKLLQVVRLKLVEFQKTLSKSSPYILTAVMPALDWPGYKEALDLEGILEYVDFMNLRTMNYYGYWHQAWGAYTGPPAPLYSGIGAYENSNVNATVNYYSSASKKPKLLNIGVPFYGGQWKNVEGSIDVKEEMWFTAKPQEEGGKTYEGGYVAWRDFEQNGWNMTLAKWHQDSRTPFIWAPEKKEFVGFENPRSLKEKLEYAIQKNLGGITIWSVEMDDDSDTLLNVLLTRKK